MCFYERYNNFIAHLPTSDLSEACVKYRWTVDTTGLTLQQAEKDLQTEPTFTIQMCQNTASKSHNKGNGGTFFGCDGERP